MAKETLRKKIMWEIDLDIDDGTYAKLKELGLAMIREDGAALANYAAVKVLEQYFKGYADGQKKALKKARGKRT
jgi:hypothetical protein